MKSIQKFALGLCVALASLTGAQASGGNAIAWDKAPVNTTDLASLQNGAKLFVNYCLNCHSAAFMRYNRLQDIGLTNQQIKDNLLFTTDKVGETMKANIDPKQAKEWFGAVPPDLTLVARSRSGHGGTGADYAFPNVGMPNPFWQLQGEREPVYEERKEHGQTTHVFVGWKQVTPGTLSPKQYDKAVGDLVNYLQWMAEPAQNNRVRMGIWVLLFLAGFTFIAWRLNAAYWKDIK
ncbi:MAG: cytochrome c1 [Betaproteobacteria bacterium]|nr:cytochrome c1 [Betaproteobacteria bacterium]